MQPNQTFPERLSSLCKRLSAARPGTEEFHNAIAELNAFLTVERKTEPKSAKADTGAASETKTPAA